MSICMCCQKDSGFCDCMKEEIHEQAREATAQQLYKSIKAEKRPDIIIAKILMAIDDWYVKGKKHHLIHDGKPCLGPGCIYCDEE